jgi:AraC family transcriptional regulator of adaptative response / DNA-3-methyladenine glycosylase II
VAMRGLGDPDAFCGTDLGVVAGARHLGLPTSPAALGRAASRWRPWRAYALQHLWATLDHAVNHLPGTTPAARLGLKRGHRSQAPAPRPGALAGAAQPVRVSGARVGTR